MRPQVCWLLQAPHVPPAQHHSGILHSSDSLMLSM
jgi:hypothetical protein